MKKSLLFLMFCLLGLSAQAVSLPDNVYFQAMQDEMLRTKKQLHVKGGPKPFYIAYKLMKNYVQRTEASLGTLYEVSPAMQNSLDSYVYIYSGDEQHNTVAFEPSSYYYRPMHGTYLPDSYEGIRRALWESTDSFYVQDSATYEQKTAYRRQKVMLDKEPDFTRAPQGVYVEELAPVEAIDMEEYQTLVQKLSAEGKALPYAEQFTARIDLRNTDVYFLDSEGDFAQYSRSFSALILRAEFRNKDGYKTVMTKTIRFQPEKTQEKDRLQAKTKEFLSRLQEVYHSVKAEPYLGPVLLQPIAAGQFFNQLFVKNIRHSKPVLTAERETDLTSGIFRDKIGQRVMSVSFDVSDRPNLRSFEDMPLVGFMPLDDEGVVPQPLELVQNGKLKNLPSMRAPVPGQTKSNGHARLSDWSLPRAHVSNVFFTPKQSLTQEELEDHLLHECRAQELEYCYILPLFPTVINGKGEISYAQRIYTADGRKEPVYGLHLEGLTTRALRDITAAGGEYEVSSFTDTDSGIDFSVVAPAIVVSEMEFTPSQRKPDRKPFVPMPK